MDGLERSLERKGEKEGRKETKQVSEGQNGAWRSRKAEPKLKGKKLGRKESYFGAMGARGQLEWDE